MGRPFGAEDGRGREITFTDATILEAVELVNTGVSMAVAARRFGMERNTLTKRAQKLGLTLRPPQLLKLRETSLVLPTDRADLGYLAGMIDGEGHISRLGRSTDGRPMWRVGITNTNRTLIDWLLAMGGGASSRPARERHKEVWGWRITAREDVLVFLEAVAPFLRMKGAKAEQAIAELRALLR